MKTRPCGRLAPSPTGDMHVGNASSALLAWLSVRARGGTLVMRMEDLDRPRVREGSAERILDDLRWMGLDWDSGPFLQSARLDLYDEAFGRLADAGRVYPCFCSRRDVAAAARAPQEPGDELLYPGTCSRLSPDDASSRVRRGERHVWRFRVGEAHSPGFPDLVCGEQGGPGTPPPGDFIVRRFDGSPSYQLAVVVDDLAMGVNEVVRGDDLLPSTARQLLLIEALGGRPPAYGHVPLILGPDGERLSKRHRGVSVRELRDEHRWSAERLNGTIAAMLGIRPGPEPVEAAELADGFDLRVVRARPSGIGFNPSSR